MTPRVSPRRSAAGLVAPAVRLVALALLALALRAPARAQGDGSPRWAGPFVTGGYLVSSPAVGPDGTVYVGSQDKYVYAISPEGTLRWRFLTGDWVDASPAVAPDGTVYAGSWDGKLYALTPAGAKKWDYSVGAGNYIYSSPALGADGTIYFGAGDGHLHALRPDGTLKWTYPAADWIDSSPAIGPDGVLYFGSWDGYVYALRDEDTAPRELWRFATNGPVLASPAVGRDGTVYIPANDGYLYALDAATGAKRWDYQITGTLEGSPALGPDGTIYLGGTSPYLHALAPDGRLLWRFPTTDPVVSTPAVRADGSVIFGTTGAAIYALHADGTQKWKVATGDWVDSSPVIAPDGTIYVGSYDRRLYALRGNGAPASRFSAWPLFRRDPAHTARTPAPLADGRLVNLSTRAAAGAGSTLIAGFVVAGSAPKEFLVRAVGPALAAFGIAAPLADPLLELHSTVGGQSAPVGLNENWSDHGRGPALAAAALRTGAFPLPAASRDAAILAALSPRPHTAVVRGAGDDTGLALVEVYDADSADPAARLVNLSTRARVGLGDQALTPGFVVGGTGPLRLLVRAVGPGLVPLGVPGALARPVLTLFAGSTALAANTGWTTGVAAADLRGAARAVGAFPLGETSADSALLVTLDPGAYTLRVAGAGDTAGEALVEVYVVP